VILEFENKTTYQEENIGEAVAKRLADRLDASERVILIDAAVVSGFLKREGFTFESLSELPAMKRAHQALGIQAFTLGTVTDVSLLSSKPQRRQTKRSPMRRRRLRSGWSMAPQEFAQNLYWTKPHLRHERDRRIQSEQSSPESH